MLILTRRPGEEILIGDNVKIAVLEVKSGHVVRIGISAPKDVSILRSEIADRYPDDASAVSTENPLETVDIH